MASRTDLSSIAGILRRLVDASPQSQEEVEAWSATARDADAQIRTKYPDVQLPALVMHFMHDADIRVKDQELRKSQVAAVREVITRLERGDVPADQGITVRVSGRGAMIGAGLLVIAAILGARSCA
jgi:hypothetical protein